MQSSARGKGPAMSKGKGPRKPLPTVCHCGSGKFPGIARADGGWCCGVCHNDFKHCPGEGHE